MKTHHIAVIISAMTPLASAEVRMSATYAIEAESFECSGGPSLSAHYHTLALCEPLIDRATSASGTQLTRHGFGGQLAIPSSLQINLSPDPLPETAVGQLSAAVLFDDGTLLPASTSLVTWAVVSGPIRSIETDGSVIPAALHADSAAAVSGQFAGVSGQETFTISDADPDNYPPFAADGIADTWQVFYFGESPSGIPQADPDADGFDNQFEFTAGLDPTDPSSVFEISFGQPTTLPGRATIRFGPTRPGRTYQVRSSTDGLDWLVLPEGSYSITDEGDDRLVTDNAAGGARKLYRVLITFPFPPTP